VTRIDYRFTGCFFASMPDSFVSSPEKTQIEAIRLFRVYTGLKIPAISEKCQNFFDFSKIVLVPLFRSLIGVGIDKQLECNGGF
jgi:hypothetical protein